VSHRVLFAPVEIEHDLARPARGRSELTCALTGDPDPTFTNMVAVQFDMTDACSSSRWSSSLVARTSIQLFDRRQGRRGRHMPAEQCRLVEGDGHHR
jgi:hypothetical protein